MIGNTSDPANGAVANMAVAGIVTFSVSVIGDNAGPDCNTPGVSSGGANLDTDGTCFGAGGTDATVASLLLGPLTDNGGLAPTHLPQAGSPAIDVDPAATCPTTDQRGAARAQDGDGDGIIACDAGAVEVAATTAPPPVPDGATWDFATDLLAAPPATNPTGDGDGNVGVWSYLSSPSLGADASTYAPLPDYRAPACDTSGRIDWYDAAGETWLLVGAKTDATTTCAAPSGRGAIHPGTSHEAVVAWRSPYAGTVSVVGGLEDADTSGGDGIAWTIARGHRNSDGTRDAATVVASGSYDNGGAQAFADGTGGAALAAIDVVPGDELYLAVNPRGTNYNDDTHLDLAIEGPPPAGDPDLTVTAVTAPPASATAGDTITVGDTTANVGTADAPETTTGYWLSSDATYDAGDVALLPGRPVAPLTAGTDEPGTASVTVPADTPAGTYTLLACADSGTTVAESDEANNCAAAGTTIDVVDPLPDLTVTAVADPPAFAAPGDTVEVGDTTTNAGPGDAAASVTSYWLSTDGVIDGTDLALAGTRSVGALTAGTADAGTTSVTVPDGTPAGTYTLLACADGATVVTESDETNNCAASAEPVEVGTAWVPVATDTFSADDGGWTVAGDPSGPPAVQTDGGNPGGWLSVTDAVLSDTMSWQAPSRYLGDLGAAYGGWLVFDRRADAAGDIASTRDVVLTASDGTEVVADLPSAPTDAWGRARLALLPGVWMDGTSGAAVSEITLRQVLATLTGIGIQAEYVTGGEVDGLDSVGLYAPAVPIPPPAPDLVLTDVRASVAQVTAGDRFDVSTTVANVGTAAAGPSRIVFHLSADALLDTGDTLLIGGQGVDGFDADQSSRPPDATVAVPSSLAPDTYWLLACVDPDDTVVELDETNNCLASPRQLTVVAPVGDVHVTDGGGSGSRSPRGR